MNDKIKLLAEQAGLKVESWMTNPPKPFQILGSTEQFEKFAELIIGHATECVRDVLRDENSDLSYEAASQVQNRIKQFFGVN